MIQRVPGSKRIARVDRRRTVIEVEIAAVRMKAPDAKILLLGIFPRDRAAGTAYRKQIAEANETIAKLADGKAVVYLDIG